MTNKPYVISASIKQFFYVILLWIKMVTAQGSPILPGVFTADLIKSYQNIYQDKSYSYNKDTDNVIMKLYQFTNNMCFLKWLFHMEN